jgi:hypothetical protein
VHTSTRLAATDFQYWHCTSAGRVQCTFADFCSAYHELDRIGVVALALPDGVIQVGRAVLALTTAFYDCLRARGADFFDYPQHFALVGATDQGVQTGTNTVAPNSPDLWAAWSWLDVWPNHKWITAAPTATGLLQQVFDWQINRLFWPYHLLPTAGEPPLPEYAYCMLRTRLKSVYYYALPPAMSTLEVDGSAAANALWEECIAQLPTVPSACPAVDCLQAISVAEFLQTMQPG